MDRDRQNPPTATLDGPQVANHPRILERIEYTEGPDGLLVPINLLPPQLVIGGFVRPSSPITQSSLPPLDPALQELVRQQQLAAGIDPDVIGSDESE